MNTWQASIFARIVIHFVWSAATCGGLVGTLQHVPTDQSRKRSDFELHVRLASYLGCQIGALS
jgi:hypothetical protein